MKTIGAAGWTDAQVSAAIECAVNLGFGIGAGVTKGWGFGAVVGAGLAAWGCRNL